MNYQQLCDHLGYEPEIEQFYDTRTRNLHTWVYLDTSRGRVIYMLNDEIISVENTLCG
jgi:hypothetical protein